MDYRVGDVRARLAEIPDGTVSLVASSPPFVALRSYLPADHPDKHLEIGSEPDPASFLDTLLGLTAEWGRVLAPWGSIAIELGDTYAGSGGGGGDYSAEGLRAGQPVFDGSGRRVRETRREGYIANGVEPPPRRDISSGWPRAKCLALVPQLYAASLAYGRNLLTGQPSPAGQWLVRNMIVWHRPNPAVGALGDKVRPSTSYIVVATRSPKRWFDLTAVRTAHVIDPSDRALQVTTNTRDRNDTGAAYRNAGHVAGAPPLDCWFDEHDTWTITTQPSRIKIEITERVPCGPDDGGGRTTSPDCPAHGDQPGPQPTAPDGERSGSPSPRTPRTDDRLDRGSPEPGEDDASTGSRSASPATARGTESNRTGHAPSTTLPGTPSARTDADTPRTSESPESCGSDPDTPESSNAEACPRVGEPGTESHSGHTSDQESACTCTFHLVKHSIHSHYAMWPPKLAERLVLMMCPREVCRVCGEPRRRIERSERRLPNGSIVVGDFNAVNYEPGFGYVGSQGALTTKSGDGDVRTHRSTLGWTSCPCADYRPGVVLDPFAGTGTTLAVAELHGRDSIGIDLDARNRDLVPARMDECRRALFGTQPELPGQGDLFEAMA